MNVSESIHFGSCMFPRRTALIAGASQVTYGELNELSNAAARRLAESGITAGDRVALLLANTTAFAVWYHATLRLGGIAVAINTRLTTEEVNFVLNDSGASLLVGLDSLMSDELEMGSAAGSIIPVDEAGNETGRDSLREIDATLMPPIMDLEPDAPATILYTSGTTGFPKGATLSHRNIRSAVHSHNHLCRMTPDDVLLIFVPLFHCYGQNSLLNAGLHVGATIVLQSRFDLQETISLIKKHKVTKLFGVPTTFQLMLNACAREDLASIDYCFSAAATLPLQVSLQWREKFGMPIYEGYGLTETAPFASYNHRLEYVPGSVGTPCDLVEMRVVDPETKRELPRGELGELAIRGPNVMLGYWNRPEATDEAIRDGWFFSGDIGRQDEAGYFFLVDRVKDMISVGGVKVFPAEVERVLFDLPPIADVAVIGVPDDILGETVAACVVLHDGETISEDEFFTFCRRHLADYKVPKRLMFLDQLPRNPSGKVLKKDLRALSFENAVVESRSQHRDAVTKNANGTSPKATSTTGLIEELKSVHQSQRTRVVQQIVSDELSQLMEGEIPEQSESLMEAGLDSIGMVELTSRLQTHVGAEFPLPATLVFEHPNINAITAELLLVLEPALKQTTPSHSPVPDTQAPKQPSDDTLSRQIARMSESEAEAELLRELDQ